MTPVIRHRAISLVIVVCISLTLNSFAQDKKDRVGHIKFDLSKNEKVEFASSTSGSIDLFVRRIDKKSGKPIFFIKGESFVSVGHKEFKRTNSISFLTIDDLLETWEKSNSVIRTNVFQKLYLYEVLESGSMIRHEVVWEEAEY